MQNKTKLGLFAVFMYGLGDILGAGIYAVIGPVAKAAGSHVWLSFVLALTVAFLTAMSYSELTARFPKSGGVSYFSQQAFKTPIVSFVSGWLLLFVSIVSMATLTTAFGNYIETLGLPIPRLISTSVFLIALAFINFWGIKESSTANIIATLIEGSGLIIVIYAAIQLLSSGVELPKLDDPISFTAILSGAALAFYAFIGFEDLANIAEEVDQPSKNLPRAILGSLTSAGAIYISIGYLTTATVETNVLAESSGPLLEVVKKADIGVPLVLFSVIALFAVANTCLLNSVTASRLLYGLAEEKLVPKILGTQHATRKTPYVSIIVCSVAAYIMVLLGSLSILAGATSVLILLVFAISNVSLLKVRKATPRVETFQTLTPLIYLALIGNLALIFAAQWLSMGIALAIALVGLVIGYFSLKSSQK